MAALERTPGFKVRRVENGSNLAFLEIAPERLAGLEERLQKANVRLSKLNEGKAQLAFNESILRRDTDYLMKALAG
jgi:threonine aldolase